MTPTLHGASRRGGWIALTVCLLAVVLVAAIVLRHQAPSRPEVESTLRHRVGVFAISGPRDIAPAAATGIQFVVTRFRGPDDPVVRSLEASRMHLVDSSIQKMIYQAACPRGPDTCRPMEPDALTALELRVRRHVEQARRSGVLVGYYVLDDFWANFGAVLGQVRRIIRDVDPKRPTLCGFYVPLAVRSPGELTFRRDLSGFRKSLVNYSSAWCDKVVLYSYVPSGHVRPNFSVDWGMAHSLPIALADLRRRGWDPSSQPLVGVPQAFGYGPMMARGGTATATTFIPAPKPEDLRTQIRAFCRYGAQTLIAYAWDDGAQGAVSMLSNSSSLRLGFRRGVDDCRRIWAEP